MVAKRGLNIVFCSTSFGDFDRRMQRITKSLGQDGHVVSWICRGKNREDKSVKRISITPLFKGGFLFYAFFNLILFFKLLFRKCDVVCAVDLDTLLPVFLVSKLRRRKMAFDAHEYFTEVPELANKSFVKSVWGFIAKRCIPSADLCYTVSPELAKIFSKEHKRDFKVVKNVPSLIAFNESENIKKNVIAYLGVVNEGRGVEVAIRSLLELKDKRLLIVGGGDIEQEMKQLTYELKLEDRVEFRGYVTPSKIQDALDGVWLAINILDGNSLSYYYSLANKYFDYIQFGLPAISMNYPEYAQLNDEFETGILIDNYHVDDFVEAVRKMEDEDQYKKFKQNIKQARTIWNWDKESIRLKALYQNL